MLMLYLLLVVALYAFVRLVQIPLECSGACGVPFAGLHVRSRVWIVTAASAIGVAGVLTLATLAVVEQVKLQKALSKIDAVLDE